MQPLDKKMWAHAVRRVCVALRVLARPMKLSHSGRKGDGFQQESRRLSGRPFFPPDKWTHPSFAESG